VAFIPRYRRKVLYGKLRRSVGRILRELLRERCMTGLHFWATGYWVSTVGRDEEAFRYVSRPPLGASQSRHHRRVVSSDAGI
jgi:REP element-mobilizing transposase RayT